MANKDYQVMQLLEMGACTNCQVCADVCPAVSASEDGELSAVYRMKGLKEILKSRNVDAVLTRQIGEIAFHTLRDHYVDIYAAPEGTVRDALAKFAGNDLPALTKPTHPSEAAGAPRKYDESTS